MASSWWLSSVICIMAVRIAVASIPTTLEGPFQPVTVQFDPSLRQGSSDLPQNDSRIAKQVTGNYPEQIALALSTPDAMWITWITGMFCLSFPSLSVCASKPQRNCSLFTRRISGIIAPAV